MSSIEILMLRKQGKWQEALELALCGINSREDEYSRMALFWVVYSICRMAEKIRGAEDIVKLCIIYMRTLQRGMLDEEGIGHKCYNGLLRRYMLAGARVDAALEMSRTEPIKAYVCLRSVNVHPGDVDKTFHDAYGWIICRYLQKRVEKISPMTFSDVLDEYFLLQTSRPSILHSRILDVMLRFALSRPNEPFDFNHYFDLWGPNNLRWEDRYAFVVFGVCQPPIVSRLLKVIEKYTDEKGMASLTDGIPRWWWVRY